MVVNNCAQYCSIVKTGIGKARMVIGGEVDASKRDKALIPSGKVSNNFAVWDCKPENKDAPINWVELKST